jgi:hypothetical protein
VAMILILNPSEIMVNEDTPTDVKVFAVVRYEKVGDVEDYHSHNAQAYNATYPAFHVGQVVTHTPTKVEQYDETSLAMDLTFSQRIAAGDYKIKIVNGGIDPADSNGYAVITLYYEEE